MAVRARTPSVRVMVTAPGGTTIVPGGSPSVEYLMEQLGAPAALTTRCSLPIGAGFGLSAAALLGTGTALSALYDLGLSRDEIARAAHDAEVVYRTGLGDVAAAQGGGIAIRRGAGVRARILRFPSDMPVFAVSFGPISTPTVLDSPDTMARVRAAFPASEPEGLEPLLQASREFAERSGLVTERVRAVLASCDDAGVPASMTMLGEGVFAIGPGARHALCRFGQIHQLTVAREGFRLLEVRP